MHSEPRRPEPHSHPGWDCPDPPPSRSFLAPSDCRCARFCLAGAAEKRAELEAQGHRPTGQPFISDLATSLRDASKAWKQELAGVPSEQGVWDLRSLGLRAPARARAALAEPSGWARLAPAPAWCPGRAGAFRGGAAWGGPWSETKVPWRPGDLATLRGDHATHPAGLDPQGDRSDSERPGQEDL